MTSYGNTDNLTPREGESKLVIENSHPPELYGKVSVKIDDVELDLIEGKRLTVILVTGEHDISFSKSGTFKSIENYKVLILEKTKSIIKVHSRIPPIDIFNLGVIKVQGFLRLTENGDIYNQDPLSDVILFGEKKGYSEDVSIYMERNVKSLLSEIEKARNEPKISREEDWYTISFVDLEIASDMTRTPNGVCHFYIFTPLIDKEFLPKFLKMAAIIQRHPCKEVLVDLTGPGGDLDVGIKVGIYIHLSGWSTTWGGYGVDARTGNKVCNSSCSNVFWGGVKRYSTSMYLVPFGIHQASSVKDKVKTCIDFNSFPTELFKQYLIFVLGQEGERLFQEIMSIPCTEIRKPLDPEKRKLFTGRKTFGGDYVDGFN